MTGTQLRASRHAIFRYLERVDSSSTPENAHRAIEELARQGRSSSKGRHWTRGYKPRPGQRFVFWVERPDVLAIVNCRSGLIRTVMARSIFSKAIDSRAETKASARARRPELKAPPSWRYSDQLSARAEAEL